MGLPTVRKFKLGFSLVANGVHAGGWRLPEAHADAGIDFKLWRSMARAAEAAKIHYIFLADGLAIRTAVSSNEELSYTGRIDQFEPLTLIAALAASTERIGYIATASTTYNEPYHVARKFASLDHISGGRVGWNIVTSWSDAEARNFNRESHLAHATRYERAEEFIDVVRGLWDSWGDDAFIRNKSTGQYFDPTKLRVLNHVGAIFSVRGPLNIPRPPQGHPILVQAGASEPGMALGARVADLIYTAAQVKEDAISFYKAAKALRVKFGRTPESGFVMPGIMPIVGSTEEEAKRKYDRVQELIHPTIGLSMLARSLGDLSKYDIDGPFPDDVKPSEGIKSRGETLIRMAREEGLTIRQLYMRMAGAGGQLQIYGTPEKIADTMEDWLDSHACDGFNVMCAYFPDTMYDFLDGVLPVLRKRGRFRDDYEGVTLRENLGLERPAL